MKSALKQLAFVVLIVSALSVRADARHANHQLPTEDVGGTVMPYGIGSYQGDTDKIAERLREVKRRGGISRFVMSGPGHSVRVNGIMDVAGYAAIGRKIGELRRKVAADGILVGYKMMPTTNCGINHPWRKFTLADGKVREFTACPGEEGFRKDFAAKCAAVARDGQPFLYLMDDDFRYFSLGCFCEDHLRRFAEMSGVARNRQEMVRALRAEGQEGQKTRMAWHRFQTRDLLLMAKAASDAVAAVSPETRVGLCAPGSFPERETAEIARALAGRHRPVIRWWGSVYGYDLPVDASGLLFSAQWSKENLPPDIECMYEADPCPHSRFYASAARMEALITTTLAFGYSAPLFQALGGRADALATSPDYIDMHKRSMDRFAAVKAEAAKGRLVGVQAFFDPDSRVGGIGGSAKKPLDVAAWYRSLNRLGIPVTTAESSVKLFAGHHAFRTMDDAAITNLLSGGRGAARPAGGIFLDGAAAETLTERGFAPLIGVKATMRDKIDFIGEHQTDWAGKGVSFSCTFHQNYGLDGCAVSRLESAGAVNVTEFSAGAKRQPAITYFENALGGKVAVMAVNLANCKTPNFFSYAKRELLVKVFRRLGGERAVPVRNTDRANVMLIANDDGERLFMEAMNLSCDPAEKFVFEVMPPYVGGHVEVLDGAIWRTAEATWEGRRVTVEPPAATDVYGTLILRVKGGTCAAPPSPVPTRGSKAILQPGGWEPSIRARLENLIERNRGNPDAYAVFDFDYTTAIGDLSYVCMWHLLETFDLKTDDFRAIFADGLPPQHVGEIEAISALAAKLKPLAGRSLVDNPDWQEFVGRFWKLYRRLHDEMGEYRAYLWRTRLFTGYTPGELRRLAKDAIGQALKKGGLSKPPYAQTEKRGLAFPPEMKDLFQALRKAGIAVYIVSGSFQETLWEATGPDFGFDLDPANVFGADLKRDAAGRYYAETVEGCVKSGNKPEFIRAHIAPRHHGKDPVLTGGDSTGDYTMLTEFKDLQLALVFHRKWRERTMWDLIASGGRVVAQGRDEVHGCFIPTHRSIQP